MGHMRKSRLSQHKQGRLIEHFVAGTTARTAASLRGVHGLHLHPVYEEGPPHYGAKAGNERTSLLQVG